jgi:hemerythrin superfamily protein
MTDTYVETNAVALLKADHAKVLNLFEHFEKADSSEDKRKLVDAICSELKIHTLLEEEIFYPAFKAAHHDKSLIPEATVEHDTIRNLISQIQGVEPVGEVFNARVKVLLEYVKHHVKEEHTDMFTDAKTAALDLNELGAQMIERKASLLDKKD